MQLLAVGKIILHMVNLHLSLVVMPMARMAYIVLFPVAVVIMQVARLVQ